MFFGDSAVGAPYNSFYIGYYSMNPRQQFPSRFWISKHNLQVLQFLILRRFSIRFPTITANCFKKLISFICPYPTTKPIQKIFNRIRSRIINHPHMSKTRSLFSFLISIKGYGTQNGAFPFTPTTSCTSFWPEKRFIHFNQTGETICCIPICHSFTDFMSHQPSCFILADFKDALHFGNRNPDLVHRHSINQPIPFNQRDLCSVKNGSCCQACLEATSFTIKKFSIREIPSFFVAALWTKEACFPPLRYKVLLTCLIIGKALLKFYQTVFGIFLGHSITWPKNIIKLIRSQIHKHYMKLSF